MLVPFLPSLFSSILSISLNWFIHLCLSCPLYLFFFFLLSLSPLTHTFFLPLLKAWEIVSDYIPFHSISIGKMFLYINTDLEFTSLKYFGCSWKLGISFTQGTVRTFPEEWRYIFFALYKLRRLRGQFTIWSVRAQLGLFHWTWASSYTWICTPKPLLLRS